MSAFSPEQYITVRAPQYEADASVPMLIEMATEKVGAEMASVRNEAIALLVLHWLAIRDRSGEDGGASGSVSMLQEGSLRRQYLVDFTLSKDQPSLTQTSWGMELLGLRRETIFGPRTRMST